MTPCDSACGLDKTFRLIAFQAGHLNLFCDLYHCMRAFLRATSIRRQRGVQISCLRIATGSRSASSVNRSTDPYPYPSNSNPTPHQIFHLPLSASQQEVKSRCVHHPIDHFTILQR